MTYHHITHKNPAFSHLKVIGKDISFAIFPQLGGALYDWNVGGITIIPPIEFTEEGLKNQTQFAASAALFPFPNRLENGTFTHQGVSYQLPINEPSNGHAIHGFIKDVVFNANAIKKDQIKLSHTHKADERFPFSFHFEIDYVFSENGLAITHTVTNTDTKSFPFGVGWHPYFGISEMDTANICFKSDYKYLNNTTMIPIKKVDFSEERVLLKNTLLDTCFSITSPEIILKTSQYILTMNAKQADFLQLFIPEDRTSIAIEPMTCIANSFNNEIGKKVLLPNKSFVFTTQLSAALC